MPDRKIHVCFVAPNAYPILAGDQDCQQVGGAEVQQIIIARGLVKRGHRVSMICLDFGQEDPVVIDGITVFRTFRLDEGLPVLRFLWPRLLRIWSCLARADADIYYQRAGGVLTGIVATFCKLNGKKSIFAVAGEPMIQFSRDRWIYGYGVRHVDQVFVQNAEQADRIFCEFGRNSRLVPNCYVAPTMPMRSIRDRILWVSTLRKLKRPEFALELAKALPSLKFTIVGGPAREDPMLFNVIRDRAQELTNVDFVGYVPYSDIDKYFDQAAVVINTSDTEGFPNTFLQAWSRSIPTISYVDCGARKNGQPIGRLVKSIPEMASAITTLMSDPNALAREGTRCREYYIDNHLPDRVLELYERIFDDLMMMGNQDTVPPGGST